MSEITPPPMGLFIPIPVPIPKANQWTAEECADGNWVVRAKNRFTISRCSLGIDARFIAAAPDLFSALAVIVESLSANDEEGLLEHTEHMMAARRALDKARGRVG